MLQCFGYLADSTCIAQPVIPHLRLQFSDAATGWSVDTIQIRDAVRGVLLYVFLIPTTLCKHPFITAKSFFAVDLRGYTV